MGRESDSRAVLTGARGGGTNTGRRRCGRGATVGGGEEESRSGGEGFFGGRRGRVGKNPLYPYLVPNYLVPDHRRRP